MKSLTPIVAVLALTCSVSIAQAQQQQQAFMGVFAETSNFKMAGMAAPKIPKLPPGIQLPPAAAAALARFGGPQRKLTVRLWSPGIAADGATASLAVPDGLKLGPKLDLDLYRPMPAATGDEPAAPGGPPAQSFDEDLVIKQYWGSSATVKAGQPNIIEFKGLSDDQKVVMKQEAAKARQGASYFYKPNWTTGYWPSMGQPGAIDADAALAGHYALTSSYTGNVEIDVPDKVNFLDPIDMSSPQLDQVVPFDQAIQFKWKNIPNALGFHASIMGMQGNKTIIMWSSSEAKPEMGVRTDYLQMAEVADFVSKQIFMPGDRVEVTVPASIFNDCDMVFMQMTGWGPGAAQDKGQPLPRVQTKTTLQIMLGGKKVPKGGFGGRPGGPPPGFGQ